MGYKNYLGRWIEERTEHKDATKSASEVTEVSYVNFSKGKPWFGQMCYTLTLLLWQ